MKDEIKEIEKILATSGKYITYAERCYVLDYITNLQEENHRLKELCNKYEEEHSTTFEEWQEAIKENERLRKREQKWEKWTTEKEVLSTKMSEYLCKWKNIKREYVHQVESATKKKQKLEDYKSRNEKAIEKIKRYESIRAYYEYQDGEYWEFNYDDDFQKELLNILQGEDKDE